MNMIHSALKHLSQKTYSEYELRDILEAQYSDLPHYDKTLNETLDYIERYTLVNDERIAQNIARHYAHKGNQFIKNTLKQRKIKSEQINVALSDIPDEYTRAREETQKRLKSILIQKCSKNEQLDIISRFLSGRQFDSETIKNIIYQLKKNSIQSTSH